MKIWFAIVLAVALSGPVCADDIVKLRAAMEQPGRHHLSMSVGTKEQQSFIPMTAIVGEAKGPTLLVLSGIHGSEHAPIVASQRLATTLSPSEISGTVLLVHIANMPAYLGRTIYTSPVDGKNLNRVFPGDEEGTLSEQIAYILTNQIYPLADVVLDMHSGDGNEDLKPMWVGYYNRAGSPDVVARSRAIAFAFGFEHIVEFQWQLTDRRAAIWAGSAAVALGIPSIDVEAGGQNTVAADAVEAIEAGVRRTMAHLKMTTASFPPIEKQAVIKDRTWISTPQDGSWIPRKKAGERINKGELIGYLTDWHGRKVFEARAPESGVLLLILTAPPVRKGETVAIIARVD